MKKPLVILVLALCSRGMGQQQIDQTRYPKVIYLDQAPSRDRMTVDDVIRLTKAGISEEVIVTQIQKKWLKSDLSTNDLLRLKNAGVSNRVIQVMMGAGSSVAPAAAPVQQTRPQPLPAAPTDPRSEVNPPVAAEPSGQRTAAPPATTGAPATTTPPIQGSNDQPPAAPSPQPSANPTTQMTKDGKLRVYVTDRPITEVISMIQGGSYGNAHASGYANGSQASYSASAYQASHVGGVTYDNRGGADPRTLEVSGDLSGDCHIPNLVITSNPEAADYILDFRRRGGTRSTWFILGGLGGLAMSAAVKVDHAGLYKPNGDLIVAAKARTVGGAVKEICPHLAQQR